MTRYELEESRAIRLAQTLQCRTKNPIKTVYVSNCVKKKDKISFTFRMNEINNRVSDVEMVTAIFSIKELYKTNIKIFWPKKSSLRKWFFKFMKLTRHLSEKEISLGNADSILDICHDWKNSKEIK